MRSRARTNVELPCARRASRPQLKRDPLGSSTLESNPIVSREPIDFVVLDALANDLEDIEQILHLANHDSVGWRQLNGGRSYTRDQIIPSLLRLVRDDLVEACSYSESERSLVGIGRGVLPTGALDDVWFVMTPRGRVVHSSWESEGGMRG